MGRAQIRLAARRPVALWGENSGLQFLDKELLRAKPGFLGAATKSQELAVRQYVRRAEGAHLQKKVRSLSERSPQRESVLETLRAYFSNCSLRPTARGSAPA